ncbi:MAG: hypothetical protein ACWGHH_06475 [Sulfurovaceae bacterium]
MYDFDKATGFLITKALARVMPKQEPVKVVNNITIEQPKRLAQAVLAQISKNKASQIAQPLKGNHYIKAGSEFAQKVYQKRQLSVWEDVRSESRTQTTLLRRMLDKLMSGKESGLLGGIIPTGLLGGKSKIPNTQTSGSSKLGNLKNIIKGGVAGAAASKAVPFMGMAWKTALKAYIPQIGALISIGEGIYGATKRNGGKLTAGTLIGGAVGGLFNTLNDIVELVTLGAYRPIDKETTFNKIEEGTNGISEYMHNVADNGGILASIYNAMFKVNDFYSSYLSSIQNGFSNASNLVQQAGKIWVATKLAGYNKIKSALDMVSPAIGKMFDVVSDAAGLLANEINKKVEAIGKKIKDSYYEQLVRADADTSDNTIKYLNIRSKREALEKKFNDGSGTTQDAIELAKLKRQEGELATFALNDKTFKDKGGSLIPQAQKAITGAALGYQSEYNDKLQEHNKKLAGYQNSIIQNNIKITEKQAQLAKTKDEQKREELKAQIDAFTESTKNLKEAIEKLNANTPTNITPSSVAADSITALIMHSEGTTSKQAKAHGYDSVYDVEYRNNHSSKPVSQMTMSELDEYQSRMKNKLRSPAYPVGLGQFTKSTRNSLEKEMGLSKDTVFTQEVQTKMFNKLLVKAGWGKYIQGKIPQEQFKKNLKGTWDGLNHVTNASLDYALNNSIKLDKTRKKLANFTASGGKANLAGIRIKNGDTILGGDHDAALNYYALTAQELDNTLTVTAFNDKLHKGTNSLHRKGLALDMTSSELNGMGKKLDNPILAQQKGKYLEEILKQSGLQPSDYQFINEYISPSKDATGGHFHIGFKNQTSADKFEEYAKSSGVDLLAEQVKESGKYIQQGGNAILAASKSMQEALGTFFKNSSWDNFFNEIALKSGKSETTATPKKEQDISVLFDNISTQKSIQAGV